MRLVSRKKPSIPVSIIYQISLVAIEERVHPTPFRTRKLSSPSPMILHNVMWESRPLPKIVRDPLAAQSARGSFLSPLRRGFFCFGDGRQAPADLKREKLAGREIFLEKGSPSPRPSLPKTFAAGPVRGWESLPKAGMVSLPEALYPGSMGICAF